MASGGDRETPASRAEATHSDAIRLYPSDLVQSAAEDLRKAPSWRGLADALALCINPGEVSYVFATFKKRRRQREEPSVADPIEHLRKVWSDLSDLADVFPTVDARPSVISRNASSVKSAVDEPSVKTSVGHEPLGRGEFEEAVHGLLNLQEKQAAAAVNAGFRYVPSWWALSLIELEKEIGDQRLGFSPTQMFEQNLAALDEALAARDPVAQQASRPPIQVAERDVRKLLRWWGGLCEEFSVAWKAAAADILCELRGSLLEPSGDGSDSADLEVVSRWGDFVAALLRAVAEVTLLRRVSGATENLMAKHLSVQLTANQELGTVDLFVLFKRFLDASEPRFHVTESVRTTGRDVAELGLLLTAERVARHTAPLAVMTKALFFSHLLPTSLRGLLVKRLLGDDEFGSGELSDREADSLKCAALASQINLDRPIASCEYRVFGETGRLAAAAGLESRPLSDELCLRIAGCFVDENITGAPWSQGEGALDREFFALVQKATRRWRSSGQGEVVRLDEGSLLWFCRVPPPDVDACSIWCLEVLLNDARFAPHQVHDTDQVFYCLKHLLREGYFSTAAGLFSVFILYQALRVTYESESRASYGLQPMGDWRQLAEVKASLDSVGWTDRNIRLLDLVAEILRERGLTYAADQVDLLAGPSRTRGAEPLAAANLHPIYAAMDKRDNRLRQDRLREAMPDGAFDRLPKDIQSELLKVERSYDISAGDRIMPNASDLGWVVSYGKIVESALRDSLQWLWVDPTVKEAATAAYQAKAKRPLPDRFSPGAAIHLLKGCLRLKDAHLRERLESKGISVAALAGRLGEEVLNVAIETRNRQAHDEATEAQARALRDWMMKTLPILLESLGLMSRSN